MSYLHIDNLYTNQAVLAFKRVYALEKIHGTSAHVSWKDGELRFFSGGESHARFVALFGDPSALDTLARGFEATGGGAPVTVYGEAYGGSQQGQSWRYGKELRFVAFDVQINGLWLAVLQADACVRGLGLEFVHYREVDATVEALDAERDAPSVQAKRNGVEGDQPREGIVIRPPFEVRPNTDERVIAKHKRDEERETATPRKVVDPARLEVLAAADRIADEWVTHVRLQHVLDALRRDGTDVSGPEATPAVIRAMTEDVLREGAGEVVDGAGARRAIGKRAAALFHAHLRAHLHAPPTDGSR